ncbi:serine protease [Photobacterium sp. SDRW27]|uniref:S1 family peptidase n=1 Tax=Photobacterium obscurum TaxID=2829490 RepID=UPI0022434C35|nr:serine protease [Photobacterium obscurum]MCW8329936.1 serine protease [Photobacterium obscurum]
MNIKKLSVAALLVATASQVYASDVSTRVIGGKPFEPAPEENWMVSLRYAPDNLKHMCGGTIIDENWVLTAAHCVVMGDSTDLSTYQVLEPGHLNILAGTLDSTVNDMNSLYTVTHVVVHPDYSPIAEYKTVQRADGKTETELVNTALDNDIALLRVQRSFDNLNAIALASPSISDDVDLRLGTEWQEEARPENTVVTGWGAIDTAGTVLSDVLLEAKLAFVPMPECFSLLESGGELKGIIDSPANNTKICTLPPKIISNGEGDTDVFGPDSCKGDSGGPLTAQNNEGVWVQLGIVSGGPVGIPVCGALSRPSFYTRVGTYYDWVESYKGTEPSKSVIGPDFIKESKAGCNPNSGGVSHTNCDMIEQDGGGVLSLGWLLLLSVFGVYRRRF